MQGIVVDAIGVGPPAGRVCLVDESPRGQLPVDVRNEGLCVAWVVRCTQDAADAENGQQGLSFSLVGFDRRQLCGRSGRRS